MANYEPDGRGGWRSKSQRPSTPPIIQEEVDGSDSAANEDNQVGISTSGNYSMASSHNYQRFLFDELEFQDGLTKRLHSEMSVIEHNFMLVKKRLDSSDGQTKAFKEEVTKMFERLDKDLGTRFSEIDKLIQDEAQERRKLKAEMESLRKDFQRTTASLEKSNGELQQKFRNQNVQQFPPGKQTVKKLDE